MKTISLTKGMVTTVDDIDYEVLSQWKWHYGGHGYAAREQHLGMKEGRKLRKTVLMHRVIMEAPDGMDVDHKNDNKLNNCRSNLRICTRSQNMANKKLKKRRHELPMGVSYNQSPRSKQPYATRVFKEGKSYFCGNHYTLPEAVKAYKIKKKELFGDYA